MAVSKRKQVRRTSAKPKAAAKVKSKAKTQTNVVAQSPSKVKKLPCSMQPLLLNKRGNPRRKVMVLYTGGTIGMEDIGGSLGLIPGGLLKRLRNMEGLDNEQVPQIFFDEFNPILDSADMCPEDWCSIAAVIERSYHDYDGFVVLHGTDTMAYTASALSFMLEQLAKPVIITGSQLPLKELLSDARQNLLGAIIFAGASDLSEVCVFFGGKLFRGNRSKKVDASSMVAFDSPNCPVLAEVGTDINVYRRRLRESPRGRFHVHYIHVTEIVVVWVIPGFSDHFFDTLVQSKNVKGVVLMLYGCGNAPARKKHFLSALKKMVEAGIVLVACSQCLHGKVVLEKYAVGKAFADCGVIAGADMTTEATVAKLSYLLSKGLSPQDCRRAMQQNLRGEMSVENNTLDLSETSISQSSF